MNGHRKDGLCCASEEFCMTLDWVIKKILRMPLYPEAPRIKSGPVGKKVLHVGHVWEAGLQSGCVAGYLSAAHRELA